MKDIVTILIVDDNIELCVNIKDILELKGYKAIIANDGPTGIEVLKQGGIDLVLMDVKMPVMNGVEAFKKMKEMKPNIPVIMMTAFVVEELIRESLQQGAFGMLKKPLDFDKLSGMIDDALPNGSLILIADDEVGLCDSLEESLCSKGYNVKVACDGISALKMVKESNFDIMLLDIQLPPLNGLETYLRIKSFRPNMITIVFTGSTKSMVDDIETAIARGAYACLEKPINVDILLNIFKKLMDQKKLGNIENRTETDC